jgi:intracellular septation protein A
VPNLIVGAVVPILCYFAGRRLWGLAGAVCLTLGWNASCQVVRRLSGRPLSGLLILGLVELVLRGLVAAFLHSSRMFFVAPAVVTALAALIYIGSGLISRPVITWVIADLVPESLLDIKDPGVARVLRKASIFYGLEQLLIAAMSVALVMAISASAYVILHAIMSWGVLGMALLVAFRFFHDDIRFFAVREPPPVLVAIAA